MATLCTHCGATLKDDAPFCNTCGTLIPSHPFRPKSARPVAPVGEAHEDKLAVGYEQDGPQLSASSVRPSSKDEPKDEPPSWMSQLEPATPNRNKISSEALQGNRRQEKPEESVETNQPKKSQEEKSEDVAEMPTLSWPSTPTFSWPPASTPVVDKLSQESKSNHMAEMQTAPWSVSNANVPLQPMQHSSAVEPLSQDEPIFSSTQRSDSSVRGLHVKVWDQKEPTNPLGPKDDVEDFPTGPLVARSPDIVVQRSSTPAPTRKAQHPRIDELERQDTVRLAAQPAAPPPFNATPQSQGGTWQRQVNSPDRVIRQPDQGPATYARPGGQPVQERPPLAPVAPIQDLKQTPPPHSNVTPKRHKRRKPLVFGLIVLLLLLGGGGVGAWIVIYHPFSAPIVNPFSVPAVTQPQTFTSSQLGLSLQYPSGWRYQNDQATATVHFYDSSHTAQFNVVVSPANGDPSLYLQQQVSHLGLTGQKAGPDLTFAGTSWHQLQGTVQQNGATYTETVFVAAHNQHFLTLTFLFPQSNYAQEDHLIFSQIRSTIQFLS